MSIFQKLIYFSKSSFIEKKDNHIKYGIEFKIIKSCSWEFFRIRVSITKGQETTDIIIALNKETL